MFKAGIKPLKYIDIIENLVSIDINDFHKCFFQNLDIQKVAMLIQLIAFQLDLRPIMMGMILIFPPPIAANQKVSGYKITGNCNPVHLKPSFFAN
jgi:hypothetical protein